MKIISRVMWKRVHRVRLDCGREICSGKPPFHYSCLGAASHVISLSSPELFAVLLDHYAPLNVLHLSGMIKASAPHRRI